MSWIRRLFGFKEKNINWKINPNGMDYKQAMFMAEQGWKVRCIEWPEGEIVAYTDGKFWKDGNEYQPSDSDVWGGMQWQTCGKVE